MELSRSLCDPCVLGPNDSPAQLTKVPQSKVEIPKKNDAFAPMTCSDNFDLNHCFFYERTSRFVVESPRVWLFGRSEGMVAKQIFSDFFCALFARCGPWRGNSSRLACRSMTLTGRQEKLSCRHNFVDFLLTTKKINDETMASKPEMLQKAACAAQCFFASRMNQQVQKLQ